MQGEPDDSDNKEMRGIVDVEQPFCSGYLFAAFAVVMRENRDCQEGEHLQRAVQLIQAEEIDYGIHQRPEDDIDRLSLEVSAVLIQKERTHDRDARPV